MLNTIFLWLAARPAAAGRTIPRKYGIDFVVLVAARIHPDTGLN